MLNQNARRTGAAGVIARALGTLGGTLGAAALLLTSTGWGALAGDTGFGAVNPKAYQGAAGPPQAGPSTGDAAKAGGDDPALLAAFMGDNPWLEQMQQRMQDQMQDQWQKEQEELNKAAEQQREEQLRRDVEERNNVRRAIDTLYRYTHPDYGDGSNTTTAPAPDPGSSVGGSNPATGSAPGSGSSVASSGPATTTTAAPNLPPLQASTDTPAEAAAWQAASDAHDAAIAAQIAMQAAQDEKTAIYFAYQYDHLTPEQSAVIGNAGGYQQYMAMMDKIIDFLAEKVEQAWQTYTEAENNAAAVARQARGGPLQ